MTQITLGGEPISKQEIEIEGHTLDEEGDLIKSAINPIKHEKVEIKSDSGWSQPYVRKVMLQEKDVGVNTQQIQLRTESDLEGIRHKLSITQSHEPPHGFLGGMWGMGGTTKIEADSIKEMFKEFMEGKLENQKEMYRHFKDSKEPWSIGSEYEYYFYRLVPMKNYIIILNPYKKLIKMFNDVGFDFVAWNKKYMAIKENPATKEYLAEIQKYKKLYEKGMGLIKQAKVIRESIRYKLGETQTYGKKTKDVWPEKDVGEVHTMLGEKVKEIKKLNEEMAVITKKGRGYQNDDILGVNWVANVI